MVSSFQWRRSLLFQHQSLRSSCQQGEASLVQQIFLATSSPTRTVCNGLQLQTLVKPSTTYTVYDNTMISKMNVQGTWVHSDLCHSMASISINQLQSASIDINQHQSALISINKHQSASISINQHQLTSISINQHQPEAHK